MRDLKTFPALGDAVQHEVIQLGCSVALGFLIGSLAEVSVWCWRRGIETKGCQGTMLLHPEIQTHLEIGPNYTLPAPQALLQELCQILDDPFDDPEGPAARILSCALRDLPYSGESKARQEGDWTETGIIMGR